MTFESNVPVEDGQAPRRVIAPLRLNNVAELRLLFASCVVTSHAVQLSSARDYDILRIIMNSEVAVQGFFVLSAYLVFGSFDRLQNVWTFYSRRFVRIYPAYFVAVVLFLALGIIQAMALGAEVRWGDVIPYLLANLSTLNFLYPSVKGVFGGNVMDAINGALWSIKVEIMFYALVPLLYRLGERLPVALLSALLILIGATWWPLLQWAGDLIGVTPPFSFRHQLPGQLHFFGLGIALFARSKGKISTATLIGLTIFTMLLLTILGSTRESLHALGLVIVIGSVSSAPQMRDIFHGNDISYGVYLCHFPLIQLLVAGGAGQWPFGLFAGTVTALVLAYGYLSWVWVERPALTRGSKRK